jgi:hypothetical protein
MFEKSVYAKMMSPFLAYAGTALANVEKPYE